MATQQKPSEYNYEITKVISEVEQLLEKMDKNPKFCPQRSDLDGLGDQLIHIINHMPHQNGFLKSKVDRFLKKALIDLTEIPTMSPKMQAVAYKTGLQEALKNLHSFLH